MHPTARYPFIFSNRWTYRLLRHASFWTFWWISMGFLYSLVDALHPGIYFRRLESALIEALIFLSAHMFLSYMLMYLVIPRYLLKQKYWKTALWTLLLFFGAALISAFFALNVIGPIRTWVMGKGVGISYRTPAMNFFYALMAGLRGAVTVGGIAGCIKLMKYWYLKEQRNRQLQRENADARLQLLKAQIHPHFLFNTLNNIYAQAQEKAPGAAAMLMELSDMLRYILYEGGRTLVPLSKELDLIRNYLALETIRYGERLDWHAAYPLHEDGYYIAPLLLLPFVENAFKHGSSQLTEQPWISLQIDIQEGVLSMTLSNACKEEHGEKDSSSGIGILNARKRLDLLYPDRYSLHIHRDQQVFVVNLSIPLDRIRVSTMPSRAEFHHYG